MIKPLNGWLIMEPIGEESDEETSAGGIILRRQHETPQTRVAKARIVRISELFHNGVLNKTELKVGDVVMYEKNARQKHQDSDGKDVYMIREVDVYIVVEEN